MNMMVMWLRASCNGVEIVFRLECQIIGVATGK